MSSSGWNSDSKILHQICSMPSFVRVPLTLPETYISKMIKYTNNYAFLFVKCKPPVADTQVQIRLTLFNPNESKHLSIEDVNLINLYMFLIFSYTILLIVHVVFLFLNLSGFRKNHILITICISFKLFETGCGLLFFELLSNYGGFSYYILFVREFFNILSDSIFLILLLLTAFGWGVTRYYLSRRETQIFWGSLLLYMLFRILYSTCIQMILCPAYIITFKVIKFLINFGIIISLVFN
jgi:hypothetical protein